MKEKNPYLYLPSSQLFPYSTIQKPIEEDNYLLSVATEACALIRAGDNAQALEIYSSAIEQYPQYPFFHACRSLLNQALGDEEGAFYDYQVAKKLDFNYHIFLEWQENKGSMLLAPELEELNRELQQSNPHAQPYINRAMLWVQHFDYELAIADYQSALARDNNAQIRVSMAAIYLRMLRYDSALEQLQLALNSDNQLHNAYLYRAKLYVSIHENEAALKDFESALELTPDSTEVLEERAGYYERIGDWQSAIADYTEVIARNPTDFYCYVMRADALEHTGAWQEAIADYDEAIRLNPHYSDLYQYRGELKEKLGDERGAAMDFEKYEELEDE
ncbi:tetratricopeptide repeat protein [Sphingobacterium paucimobilis]|uniref:Tetratricopeptide repeat protein n=1 Tax=Sphingobacterium paucimobilis HER1398 TaxID=1346330 RepID=U2HYP2_9SPHI|nr:tetratricopeptide repeat protein [Sphingobacterium paucimobilis]ERJ60390.1 hypothetical protein M472_16685 [Sphingobacterium paucimobilis HER1398]